MRTLVLLLGLALSHTAQAASPCDEGTFVGDLEVTPETVEELAAIRCVVGHLTFSGTGVLVWPSLWRTVGHVTIAGTQLTEVLLPDLDEVWQHLTVEDNAELRRLDFPRFGSLNARAVIRGNPELTEIAWGALGAINGSLTITQNARLMSLDFDSLGSILGRLVVVDNPALPTCALAADLGPLLRPGPGRLVVVSGNGSCILETR